MTMTLIGWAIIQSLWQGGVIALAAAGALAATRGARPQIRYAISLLALGLMIVLPLCTATLTNTRVTRGDSIVEKRFPASTHDPVSTPAASPSRSTSTDIPDFSESIGAETFVAASSTAKAKAYIDVALPWVVVAWILGLLVASAKLIGGFARTRTITRRPASTPPRSLTMRVERLCDRLGITRVVRVLESTHIEVPLVIGAIRPVIVVPASLITGLTPLQLDMLLAHELAHVWRHDYVVNLVQTVLETLLFYHPAARWISDRAREERENCCDDLAVATCGGDPTQYTSTLLVLEEARGQGFGLAAAATGGSLLRRAERLMTGRNSHVQLGPRWIAGVLTITAALFTSREAVAGIQSSYLPGTPLIALHDTIDKQDKSPDNSRAQPAKVIKAPLEGSIADRWKWAEENAGSGSFWIGYLVAGDLAGKSRYYTSEMPMRIGGNVMLSGRVSLGDGDLSSFVFSGVPLAPLFGAHSPNSTAIFLQVTNGVLGRRIDRVHLATFSLPVHFDRKTVVWLDSASDGESLALLRSVMSNSRDSDTRRDIVGAIGVHRDRSLVSPILIDILGSRDVEGVRREAAKWLGHSHDSAAMTALSRAARREREKGVRKEAIEAFGQTDTSAGTDTLIAFASDFDESDLRRTAIESLGNRADDRALDYLTRLVQSPGYDQIKRRALEALADMPGGRGLNVVIDLARTSADPRLRYDAVEFVARIEPSSRAFDILRKIVATDPDQSVSAEAVETIAEVHDPRSVQILADVANNSSRERIQVEAVESLGETVDPASALIVLKGISRNHPSPKARSKALEAIVALHDEGSVEALVHAARADPDGRVRNTALEALGEADDPAAAAALASFVRGNDPLEIRAEALEAYANAPYPEAAIARLRGVIASDPSSEMRLRAVELLEDVTGDAGIEVLREIARTHPDQRLRSKARSILTNR